MAVRLPGMHLVRGNKVRGALACSPNLIAKGPIPASIKKHILVCLMLILTVTLGACASSNLSKAPAACRVPAAESAKSKTIAITTAKGRSVPLEILHPDGLGKYPLVVFSHGAFASPNRYHALLKPIAAAGYVVLAPRHLDSADWVRADKPGQAAVWESRGEDIVLMLSENAQIKADMASVGIEVDYENIAAVGHSYGALIAQIAGGARPIPPTSLSRNPSLKAVVAYSPPGVTPYLIDKNGWSDMAMPSLTITGTADILPGFIDEWQVHKDSHDLAPPGKRWLWVGEGVNHYFGGMIGREKPASEQSRKLFVRALATTITFLDQNLGAKRSCSLELSIAGESLFRDGVENE